jgi:Protein kinase domain/Transglycosylase SLT domain
VMGTVSYMSPEQARGLAVDERTDIWSLGVVLYEMLSGRLPFSGATRMDTMVAILDREPAPFDISRPRLQSIVQKCLSKEMEDRYRTVSDLVLDLKAAREESDSVIPNSPRRVWSIAGLVILLIAATAGIIIYRQTRITNLPAVNTVVTRKLYAEMNEQERLDFVAAQEQRISAMMSDRPVKLNTEAVSVIKKYVDRYAARMNDPAHAGEDGTKAMFERAPPYVPLIARSFAAQKVPIIIGIYLPVVESGYKPCYESPLGSKGLYQFLPSTAKIYGIPREDMCDAEKTTPAAARYMADHMAELGDDSESVTLVLVSYNRGAQWVRNTLRQLRATENYERNFWTLLANAQMLDESFRRETIGYVPSFYAAAIIGENPEVFGLNIPPLSSIAK